MDPPLPVVRQTAEATSGVKVTEFKGMCNNDDPRVFRFVPTRGSASSEAKGHLARVSTYGPTEIKPTLPMKADEAFEKTWPSEVHFLSQERFTNDTRYNVYYSPKLMYLKIAVLAAEDLVPAEEGRSLAPTTAKMQLGAQIRRTRPQGSANPVWREEFLFVVSEPLEDPLVVTVEERVGPGRDEPVGRLIIPVNSPYVPRNDLAKLVPSKWFILSRGIMVDAVTSIKKIESSKTFASKIHLRMSLETAYHVLDESTQYASDLQPACHVRS